MVLAAPHAADATRSRTDDDKVTRCPFLRRLQRVAGRLLGLAVLALLLAAPVVRAAADQPRTAIQGFYDTLLEVMKQATKLGFQGRYQRLQPAIEQTYDLPFMTRVAIGPAWAGMTPMQQQQAIEAFAPF